LGPFALGARVRDRTTVAEFVFQTLEYSSHSSLPWTRRVSVEHVTGRFWSRHVYANSS
jgi:hypothetical protein